jgi:hypothetical protein
MSLRVRAGVAVSREGTNRLRSASTRIAGPIAAPSIVAMTIQNGAAIERRGRRDSASAVLVVTALAAIRRSRFDLARGDCVLEVVGIETVAPAL